MRGPWSDTDDATLRQLWRDGRSAREIGMQLDRTRNAVIGRVFRLELPPHTLLRSAATKRKTGKGKRRRQAVSDAAPASLYASRLPLDGLPIPDPKETDIPRVATVDLEPIHCRWPCAADPLATPAHAPQFCGMPRLPGLSYCLDHARRAFQPPPPRRRETRAPVPVEAEPILEAA